MLTPIAKAQMRAAGLKQLEEAYRRDGDRYSVLQAVLLAAAGREPVAEWVRVALWEIHRGLSQGQIADLNAAFDWRTEGELSKRTRAEGARYRRYAQDIFIQLWEARRGGVGMTALTFEEIAERFGVGRSLVQKVWQKRKAELLAVKAGDPPGNHSFVIADFWDR